MQTAHSSSNLVARLIARGDQISIEHGRLLIQAASKKKIPRDWLKKHQHNILSDIANACKNRLVLKYEGYSTGEYNVEKNKHSGGLTLNFIDLAKHRHYHAVYNAQLTQDRKSKNRKAGSARPKGRFKVGKKSNFYKFWLQTQLEIPHSLTAFYDYMGKLKQIVFTANAPSNLKHPERIRDKISLVPLCLTHEEICSLFLKNTQIKSKHTPIKKQIANPNKELDQSQQPSGVEPNLSTSINKHDKRNQDSETVREIHTPFEEQTEEEWLSDYENSQMI